MAVFNQGGGGGRAGATPANEEDDFGRVSALDLTWPMTPDGLERLNEYLRETAYAIQRIKRMVTKADGSFLDDVTSQRLLGRYAGTDGQIQEIEIGDNLELTAAGILNASSGGGGGLTDVIEFAQLSISNAELSTLNTTPLTIVAAPGASRALFPTWWMVDVIKTIASGGASPNLRVRWDGQTTDLAPTLVLDLATGTRNFVNISGFANSVQNNSTAHAKANKALKISSSADNIGSSDASLLVTVAYVDLPVSW